MVEGDNLSMERSQPKLFQGGLGICDGEGREREDASNVGELEASFILRHSSSPPARKDYRQIE